MAELPEVVNEYIFELEKRLSCAEKAFNNFKSVLCDPDGYLCFDFTDGDKEEIQKGFVLLERAIS